MSQNKVNEVFLQLVEEAQIRPSESDLRAHDIIAEEGTLDYLEAAVKAGLLPKDTGCKLWGKTLGFAYINPLTSIVTEEAMQKLPLDASRRHKALGLYFLADVLTVAMAEPEDGETMAQLQSIAGCKISPVFSLPCEIFDAIEVQFSNVERLAQSMATLEKSDHLHLAGQSEDNMASFSQSRSLVSIFDTLLFLAIKAKTSQIHLEPQKNMTQVRFRCQGRLIDQLKLPLIIHKALVTRLGALCNLESRQGGYSIEKGSFILGIGAGKASFLVSFLPSIHGVKVVISVRLTKSYSIVESLDEMLMSAANHRQLSEMIARSNGLLLLAGRPESGVADLFNAIVKELSTTKRSIHILEDFVEVQWPGLTQSLCHRDPGSPDSSSALLKALINQDVDVIGVRGMDDSGTMRHAVEASLCGHLVIATISSNDICDALARLCLMGIDPESLAGTLLGVVSRRHVRRICGSCKQAYEPSPDILEKYFSDWKKREVIFYRGEGCDICQNTGYHGRITLFELLRTDDKIQTIIAEKPGSLEAYAGAIGRNWHPIRYDGLLKALLGLTTIEEVEKASR